MKKITTFIILVIMLVHCVDAQEGLNESLSQQPSSSTSPWEDVKLLISIIALIISGIALFIGFRGVRLQYEQNELSLKPLGIVECFWDEEKGKIQLIIRNEGNGPMIIKTVEASKDETIIDVTESGLDREEIIPKEKICKSAYDLEDFPIKSGGCHLIFECSSADQEETAENVHSMFNGWTIILNYTDIFGNPQKEYSNTIWQ